MAVDIRRSGSRQAMRIFRGSTDTTPVRWYRCLPTADTLPFPTAIDAASIWESREWSKNRPIGEATRWGTATIDDVMGKPPGKRPCGNPAWFVLGVPPAFRDSRDCRCVPFQFFGDLVTDGRWSQINPRVWTGTGDVLTEGEWSGLFIKKWTGKGEVVTEGEWRAHYPARWTGTGDVLTEGEWSGRPVHQWPGSGDVLTEGEWSAEFAGKWRGTGDVLTEGEWSAVYSGPWRGTGDVLTEGEWSSLHNVFWAGTGDVLTDGEWSASQNDCTEWLVTLIRGMSFTELAPWQVRFNAANSLNCGGANDSTQFGTATHCFFASGDGIVSVTLTGRTEREDAGFDIGRVYIDGVLVAEIGSTGEGLGCAMGDHTATAAVGVDSGRHDLRFTANTIDQRYHVGAFWQLTVIFVPGWAGEGEVVTEGEWSEGRGGGWGGTADVLTEGEWDQS
jgi:hypothetical protein